MTRSSQRTVACGEARLDPPHQLPRGLRWADDPRGLTWRAVNLARRASLRRSLRFARGWLAPVRHERPIFVLGAPRSGTTLVFHLLRESSGLGSLDREGHDLWRTFHHPRYSGWRSDAVGLGEVRRGERRFVAAYLHAHFDERRFVEKTPESSLRVPYLLELFPDASFVVVRRHPLDVVSSLIDGWRDPAGRFRSYFVPEDLAIPGYPHRRRWCFALIEGWRELRSAPIPEIAFAQWRAFAEALEGARLLPPPERWTEVRFEELLAAPDATLGRLAAALGLLDEPALRIRLHRLLARPVNALAPGERERWRRHAEELEPLLPRIARLAPLTGYRLAPAAAAVETGAPAEGRWS